MNAGTALDADHLVALAPALSAALRAAVFTEATVDDLLGPGGATHVQRRDLAPVERRLRDGDALTTLVRLFVVGLPATREATSRALDGADLGAWASAGLLAVADDRVYPLVHLQPLGNLIIASDLPVRAGQPDYVMRVSATTLALAGLTIRRPGRTALDIGCGSGFQALLAAAHSEQVIAFDANPRAVAFARFNACLNGIDNVTCREGDLFAPLSDGPVDLVVSNPPYVISPGLEHQFRDSGQAGDAVCRHLARSIAGALAPDGIGHFLANWPVPADGGWRERLAEWFEASGCQVWVLHETTEPASSYAAHWLHDTENAPLGPEHLVYDRWMRYFEEGGIAGVGYGLVTLRKLPSASGHLCIEDAPDDYVFPCSADMAEHLERYHLLADWSDDEILQCAWQVAPEVVLDEARRLDGARWVAVGHAVRRRRGLCWRHAIDDVTAAVLARCDGSQRLDVVLAEVARGPEHVPAGVTDSVVPQLRRLIEHGMLLLD